jgi:hypothetical protein
MNRPLIYIEGRERLVGNLSKEPAVKIYFNQGCSFFDMVEHGPWLDSQMAEVSELKQVVKNFYYGIDSPPGEQCRRELAKPLYAQDLR